MSEAPPRLPEGFRLHGFDAVGSTNDEAKALARAGAPAGTIVWARQQLAGRGRRGRAWASPPGNLYLSIVARPDDAAMRAAQLGFVAALALGDALAQLAGRDIGLRFKWPNDILLYPVAGSGRKLAGILLESETGATGVIDFLVIGVGVNLVSKPEQTEFPAISLGEIGIALSSARLIEAFVSHFAAWSRRWQTEGFAPVRAAWLARAVGLGDMIRVRLERATLHGRFLDIDGDGALLLEAGGDPRRIAAGEVFLMAG